MVWIQLGVGLCYFQKTKNRKGSSQDYLQFQSSHECLYPKIIPSYKHARTIPRSCSTIHDNFRRTFPSQLWSQHSFKSSFNVDLGMRPRPLLETIYLPRGIYIISPYIIHLPFHLLYKLPHSSHQEGTPSYIAPFVTRFLVLLLSCLCPTSFTKRVRLAMHRTIIAATTGI